MGPPAPGGGGTMGGGGTRAAAAAAWAAIREAARYLCWNSRSWRCCERAERVEARALPGGPGAGPEPVGDPRGAMGGTMGEGEVVEL